MAAALAFLGDDFKPAVLFCAPMIAVGLTPDPGPVMVVIPSPGRAGYRTFYASRDALEAPHGSGWDEPVGASIAKNCNAGIRLGMARPQVGHFFFLDDDHEFAADTLLQLLSHGLPVVCAATTRKVPPFAPCFYKERAPDGDYLTFGYVELAGKAGLLEVAACGRAGLLVKREVLERLGDPWFRLGQSDPEECREDWDFCERARGLGYKIMVDLDTPIGHIDPVGVWLKRMPDGRYGHVLRWHGGQTLGVNPPEPKA